MNDPATGAMVLIMQRLHELDPTGYLLEQEPGVWTLVRIPLEAETDERWVFPLSGRVVERKREEVLQPERFPPATVEQLKGRRLSWAGQYQQRPSPIEGNLIKRSDARYYGGIDPRKRASRREAADKFRHEIDQCRLCFQGSCNFGLRSHSRDRYQGA